MTTINGLTGIDKIVPQSLKILDAINSDEAVSKNQLDTKPTGFKNLIINGGFDVWQRGTSFTNVGMLSYTADRYVLAYYSTSVSKFSATVNNSNVSAINIVGDGNIGLRQGIELPAAGNSGIFTVGKTFTISFWAKTTNAVGSDLLFYHAFVDSPGSNTNAVSGGSTSLGQLESNWVKYEHTFAIAVSPNSTNLAFEVTPYAVNSVVGSDIQIAQVQLEEGSVATPFEQRPYVLELSLCQRYYETSFVSGGGYSNAFSTDAGIIYTQVAEFRVKKRVIPTISFKTSSASMSFMTYTTSKSGIYGYYASASSRQYTWAADAEL